MAELDGPTGGRRRRRRAVGPVGALPAVGPASDVCGQLREPREQDVDERSADEDERLRRDVPPHHGA